MTKQVMGVPSLKPENLAAQAFFRSFLDKYTKLDDKVKNDMTQHVPKATKLFDAAGELKKIFVRNSAKYANPEISQFPIKLYDSRRSFFKTILKELSTRF